MHFDFLCCSFREIQCLGCREKAVFNGFPRNSEITRLSINDIWEFSFFLFFLPSSPAISHFLFKCHVYPNQLCFRFIILFYFPRLCARGLFLQGLHVTLTCLVMQMSSMQIHSRFVFERQLSLLYQLLVFSFSLFLYTFFCYILLHPCVFQASEPTRPQNQPWFFWLFPSTLTHPLSSLILL